MRERAKSIAGSFFISVTLINLAMLILGLLLRPDQKFGYEVFVYPLIYGAIGIIPALFASTRKELTVKQAVIKEIVQMTMTVAIILLFMFAGRPMTREMLASALGVAISVMIVYVLVMLILWLMDLRTAKNMTEELKRFQEEQRDNGDGSP